MLGEVVVLALMAVFQTCHFCWNYDWDTLWMISSPKLSYSIIYHAYAKAKQVSLSFLLSLDRRRHQDKPPSRPKPDQPIQSIPMHPILPHLPLLLQLPQRSLAPLHHRHPILPSPRRRRRLRQIRPDPRDTHHALTRLSHLRDVVVGLAAAEDNGLGRLSVVFAAEVGFVGSLVGAGRRDFAFEKEGKLDYTAGGGLDEVDY